MGVNGWAASNVKLPKPTPANVICLEFLYAMSGDYSQWTIIADNKSCWIKFHYSLGSGSTVKGTDVYSSSFYHPQLFFGAIKGPDFNKDEQGNFFCGYGSDASAAAAASAGSQATLSKLIGLRTPLKLVPTTNADYSIGLTELSDHDANPHNTVRMISPIFIYYSGTDRPKPSGISEAQSKYIFAQVPGVAQFSKKGSEFWKFYTSENSVSYNIEILEIDGEQWMPVNIFDGSPGAGGITSSAEWWT